MLEFLTPDHASSPRRIRVLLALVLPVMAAVALVGLAPRADAAMLPANPRTFSCTGSLGEAVTQRTVTGNLSAQNVPYEVSVVASSTGAVESHRARKASSNGASWLHAGYVDWNVTGPNPRGDLYHLHLPPVLPGAGGFYDATLEIQIAGGANGSWQIPMFDCTVSNGPAWMSTPSGVRNFSCSGSLGEAFTQRTVTGKLTSRNVPYEVSVVASSTGAVESHRARKAASNGASWLHAGYVDWNVTGPNPRGDLYHLHLPPVLPGAGGFHDADLEILFAGGANGSWQIPMFDCTVN